jgi:hypothetical protein
MRYFLAVAAPCTPTSRTPAACGPFGFSAADTAAGGPAGQLPSPDIRIYQDANGVQTMITP